MNGARLNRKVHSWVSVLCALPLLVVLCSGLLLMLKKDFAWIQPPTQRGADAPPSISFDAVLKAAAGAPAAGITSWADIDRMDVRPSHGVIKVRSHRGWEVQVDASTGQVLHTAFRRSDFIEAIHDGSFFHDLVKQWIFLPTAVAVLMLWVTGMYLWLAPRLRRWSHRPAANRAT